MRVGPGHLVLGAFVVEAILAGGNGVGVKFSNQELDPLWGAGLRFALASFLPSPAVPPDPELSWTRGVRASSALYRAPVRNRGFGARVALVVPPVPARGCPDLVCE